MVSYFSDHLNINIKEVAWKCGIDEVDLEYSLEMIEILGIDPEDLKKQQDSSQEQDSDSNEAYSDEEEFNQPNDRDSDYAESEDDHQFNQNIKTIKAAVNKS